MFLLVNYDRTNVLLYERTNLIDCSFYDKKKMVLAIKVYKTPKIRLIFVIKELHKINQQKKNGSTSP